MDLALPQTLAEALPFAVAALTVLLGLVALFAPRLALAALGLAPAAKRPGNVGGSRASLAGFWIGVGLVTLAFYNQPFMQMALGAGWLFSAFGRLISNLSDEVGAMAWVYLLVELALAGAALAPVFGFLAP